ncbi:MFS transporter [Acidisphaera sp. S103]|uniref:MFS transporter n=1 Tax=Acidisphaera sp. S103 TaxID=1747223 RepID=UPI00131E414F|nr:MFS transporter [Acidisphaera sp. S103]
MTRRETAKCNRETPNVLVNVSEIIDAAKLNAYHLRVVGLCALLIFFDGFDLQAISYAAPAVSGALGISRPMLGPVFSAGFIGLTTGALAFGLLGDRWGRKTVFILCGVLFGLASLGTATSGDLTQLLLWRLLAGFGLGGATPISITIATDYCPTRLRATLTMIMYCGFTFGGVFGGWIASLVLPYGWEVLFYIGGAVPLLLAPLLMLALPETVEFLVNNNRDPGRIAHILARVQPGFVAPAGARFVLQHQDAGGFQVVELFRHGRAVRTLLLWGIFFSSLVALFAFSTWLPSLLNARGLTSGQIVGITGAFQGGGLVGSLIFARLILRFRPFLMIAVGYLASSVFLVVFSRMPAVYPLLFVSGLVAGICLVGTQNLLNAMSAQLYPPAIRSTGVGWAIGVGRSGAILGPSIAGLLLAFHFSGADLFLFAAVPPAVAGLITFVLLRTLGDRVG